MDRVTRRDLTSRIGPARQNSVEAFVISIVTGEDDPSKVDPTDPLTAWGYDDRNIDALADTINKAKWHKVRVTYTEIEQCKTIQKVIDLVAKKVKVQMKAQA